MLMVLNLHSFWGYDHNHGSMIIQAIDFFRESTSICAVNAFILISGYFGIKWKPKSFFNLIFQCFFYSFVVYGVAIIVGAFEFQKTEFIECFKALFKSWGFITSYIVLYFLSPLLNAFADKSSSREMLIYIVILFFAENFIFLSYGTINFCLLYLIGRYVRKTKMPERLRLNPSHAYWITTLLLFIIVFVLYLTFHWDAVRMCKLVIAYSYSSPLVILQAVFLFLIFSRFNFESRVVNWCASSCLAIFLIHMHPAIKYIGYYNITESLYERPVLEHIFGLILIMSIVFFGSILVDKVRIALSDITYKTLFFICNKIPHKFFSLDVYMPRKVLELN